MPFVLGFVGVAAFCVALFVIVSRKNVALACGEHASISTNSNIKKAGISLLAALLIVGSCASFTKAFADMLDESKLTGEAVVNLNADYSLNSIYFRINNQTGVDLTGKNVFLHSAFYTERGGDHILLDANDAVFKSGETVEYTASPADLSSDYQDHGFITDSGTVHSLEGLQVANNIVDELKATGTSETLNSAFWMVFSYDGWTVSLIRTDLRNDGGFGSGQVIDSGDCLNNTVQDYSVLVSSVESYIANHSSSLDGYEFVGFNTAMKGDGETVDEAYLASHPITADTTFYAIFKEKTAGNDAPNADNPAQPGTPGDATDTPEVSDPDANAEADANKGNAEATDPAQNVEGTKEGDQAEQTA